MEVNPPHQLGLGCVRGALNELRRFLSVTAVVVRLCLLSAGIRRGFRCKLLPEGLELNLWSVVPLGAMDANIGLGEACSR